MREIPSKVLQTFREGTVIPILPYALAEPRKIDEERQRALVRYYVDAGAGGIAVLLPSGESGKQAGTLFAALRSLASEAADRWGERKGRQTFKLAEVVGRSKEAVEAAESAYREGYHACLVDLSGPGVGADSELLDHVLAVAQVMPVIGHLRRSAGCSAPRGPDFWRKLLGIDNLVGLVLGSSDRFQTVRAVRAVCEAGREKELTLYTGSDDAFLVDLLTSYKIPTESGIKQVRLVGGLLAPWGVWTSKAVELVKHVHSIIREARPLPVEFLSIAVELSDATAAVLDAEHAFAGQTAGIQEILRRQGLLRAPASLEGSSGLSQGQAAEIERVLRSYPHLTDDDFVAESLSRWLAE